MRRREIRPISLTIAMMVQEMLRIQETEIEILETLETLETLEMEETEEMYEMVEMVEMVEMFGIIEMDEMDEMDEMFEMGEIDRDIWNVSVTGMDPITEVEMVRNLRAACSTNNIGPILVHMVDKVDKVCLTYYHFNYDPSGRFQNFFGNLCSI